MKGLAHGMGGGVHERFGFLDHRQAAFMGSLGKPSRAVQTAEVRHSVSRGGWLQGPEAGGPCLNEPSTKIGEAFLLPKPGPSGLGTRPGFGGGEEEG